MNNLELKLSGKKFVFWTQATIRRSIDGIDQFEFLTPMNTGDSDFRNIFRPFTYPPMEVSIDGETIFSGTIIDMVPELQDDSRILTVSGYSLPGVLNDCTPSAASDTEFNRLKLADIATSLCEPFGVFVDTKDLTGGILSRARMESGQKILPFLIHIAKQQGLFLTNTEKGFLEFVKPAVKKTKPVARLIQGEPPFMTISVNFNSQDYFSDITALRPSVIGGAGTLHTVKNEKLEGTLRPLVFVAEDSDKGNLKGAASSKMGRMFGNAVSYTIEVPTWRDSFGKLWEKNTLINIKAPDVMVYSEYTFLIRGVEFFKDENSETATLSLVLPESFTDKIPESMPWD